jgi:hypothetical protein
MPGSLLWMCWQLRPSKRTRPAANHRSPQPLGGPAPSPTLRTDGRRARRGCWKPRRWLCFRRNVCAVGFGSVGAARVGIGDRWGGDLVQVHRRPCEGQGPRARREARPRGPGVWSRVRGAGATSTPVTAIHGDFEVRAREEVSSTPPAQQLGFNRSLQLLPPLPQPLGQRQPVGGTHVGAAEAEERNDRADELQGGGPPSNVGPFEGGYHCRQGHQPPRRPQERDHVALINAMRRRHSSAPASPRRARTYAAENTSCSSSTPSRASPRRTARRGQEQFVCWGRGCARCFTLYLSRCATPLRCIIPGSTVFFS